MMVNKILVCENCKEFVVLPDNEKILMVCKQEHLGHVIHVLDSDNIWYRGDDLVCVPYTIPGAANFEVVTIEKIKPARAA
jgi:hypothetical protein